MPRRWRPSGSDCPFFPFQLPCLSCPSCPFGRFSPPHYLALFPPLNYTRAHPVYTWQLARRPTFSSLGSVFYSQQFFSLAPLLLPPKAVPDIRIAIDCIVIARAGHDASCRLSAHCRCRQQVRRRCDRELSAYSLASSLAFFHRSSCLPCGRSDDQRCYWPSTQKPCLASFREGRRLRAIQKSRVQILRKNATSHWWQHHGDAWSSQDEAPWCTWRIR